MNRDLDSPSPDRSLQLLDPTTNSRCDVVCGDGLPIDADMVGSFGWAARTPGGSRILSEWSGSDVFLARLDADGQVLIRARTPVGSLLGSLADDSAIAISADHRQLIRVYFGSSDHDVLFPRPTP